jgi:alpha 1,6-mannosyltransferase
MLTFRRALIFAACIITVLFLITRTHTNPTKNDSLPPTDASDLRQNEDKTKTGYVPTNPVSTSSTGKLPPVQGKKNGNGQQLLQDLSQASLRDKLLYQFPYDVESKFPAYIWQTWKYTPASGDFGENFRPAEASWSEKHPGFIHEVITDQVAVHLLRHLYASVPEVLEAYNALPMAVLKADFFRYLILLARGGIYSDIDTYALKSAAEWLPESVPRETIGLVIGIEADPDRPDWKEWYSRRIQFCQWTIQSKPGHPVLREIVANITQETLKKKKSGELKALKDNKVIEFTGPAVWTDTIFNFLNDEKYFDMSTGKGNITWRDFTGMTASKKVGDVVVLPITSFSPGVQQMGAEDYEHPMAFVKHEFEGMHLPSSIEEFPNITVGTWKPENLRHIGAETKA